MRDVQESLVIKNHKGEMNPDANSRDSVPKALFSLHKIDVWVGTKKKKENVRLLDAGKIDMCLQMFNMSNTSDKTQRLPNMKGLL